VVGGGAVAVVGGGAVTVVGGGAVAVVGGGVVVVGGGAVTVGAGCGAGAGGGSVCANALFSAPIIDSPTSAARRVLATRLPLSLELRSNTGPNPFVRRTDAGPFRTRQCLRDFDIALYPEPRVQPNSGASG